MFSLIALKDIYDLDKYCMSGYSLVYIEYFDLRFILNNVKTVTLGGSTFKKNAFDTHQ